MKEDNTTIDPTWMERTGGFARDMTLRQWYAGLAMQAIVGREDFEFEDWAWENAYDMADEMLAKGKEVRDSE